MLSINPKYDPNKITSLLKANDFFDGDGVPLDEINNFFMERSISYGDYLAEFGIGLLLLPSLVHLLDAKITAKYDRDKKKNTRSKTSSVISGHSYISNINAIDNGMNLIINIQVPLNQPEKSNIDEHKPPVIIPIEFSNRRVVGRVTSWKSPDFIRMEALNNKNKTEIGQYDNNSLSRPARPCVFQTPQTQMRGINQELINNQYLKLQSAALSEGDCEEHKNEDFNS